MPIAEFSYDYRGVTLEPIGPDVDIEVLPPIPELSQWDDIGTWWMVHLWEEDIGP